MCGNFGSVKVPLLRIWLSNRIHFCLNFISMTWDDGHIGGQDFSKFSVKRPYDNAAKFKQIQTEMISNFQIDLL